MIEFLQMYLTALVPMMAVVAVLAMVIGGVVRFVCALFSNTIRKHIAAHPVKHVLWGLASAACIVALFLPLMDVPSKNVLNVVQAKNDLFMTTTAIKAYHSDKGAIITGGNVEIVKVLRGKVGEDTVYLEPPPKELNSAGEFIDPWKTPYRLGMSADGFPWAYSCGPDGKDDGGAPGSDDIASW